MVYFNQSGKTTDDIADNLFGGDMNEALDYIKYAFITQKNEKGKNERIITMDPKFYLDNKISILTTGQYAQSGRPTPSLENMKKILLMDDEPVGPEEEAEFITSGPARKIPKTGAAFEGITQFKEYEDDNIYIPSNYHCLFKCAAKIKNISFEKLKEKIPRTNPYGINNVKFNKIYRKLFEEEPPQIVKLVYNKKTDKFNIVRFSGHGHYNKKLKFTILLMVINNKNEYHAILLKTDNMKNINFETDIFKNIEFEQNYNITKEQRKYRRVLPPKAYKTPIYVWDIETASEDTEAEKKKCVPYMCGFSHVDEEEYNKALKGEDNTNIKKNIKIFHGLGCLVEMLDALTEDKKEKILFAHNGGRFDTIFIKGVPFVNVENAPNMTILSELNAAGTIKELKIKYNDTILIFKDSCCFTLASLNKTAENLGIKQQKEDFNIINKSFDFFKKQQDKIKKYLIQDIYLNGLIIQDFENKINKNFNQSVRKNTGIPSIAWNVLNVRCHGMDKQYISADPSTCKFIRASFYGGRVIHWAKGFKSSGPDNKMISLDGNSLYPSAMACALYPIGKFEIIKDKDHFKEIKKAGLLYIAEVEMDGKNCRYPLVPYKTEKGELIYPSNKFVGIYNSVDIEEAESMGYEVTDFKKGIYWKLSANIFGEFIKEVYNERLRLKKIKSDLEYLYKILLNSAFGKFSEYIDDNLFFEENPEEFTAKLTKDYTMQKLKNGQTQIKVKDTTAAERKPFHISSFILANSRKIMNNYIKMIGYENIYYGDTDSVYTTFEAFKKSGIIETSELGGIKNDYSENTFIYNAKFLDIKRYFLELQKEEKKTVKFKFNGLKFQHDRLFSNYLSLDNETNTEEEIDEVKKAINDTIKKLTAEASKLTADTSKLTTEKIEPKEYEKFNKELNKLIKEKTEHIKDEKIKLMYLNLEENKSIRAPLINERWQRTKTDIFIEDVNIDVTINPEKRAKWINNIFYPLDFNNDKPERHPDRKITTFKYLRPYVYDINPYNKTFNCALPLQRENGAVGFLTDAEGFNASGITARYFQNDNKDLIYRMPKPQKTKKILPINDTTEPVETTEKTEDDYIYYKSNEHGPIHMIDGTPEDLEDYKMIIFTDNIKCYKPDKETETEIIRGAREIYILNNKN